MLVEPGAFGQATGRPYQRPSAKCKIYPHRFSIFSLNSPGKSSTIQKLKYVLFLPTIACRIVTYIWLRTNHSHEPLDTTDPT
jgi:hypothetical protein